MLVALPGSVLITTKVPELAFFEASLHYLLSHAGPRGGGAPFLEMHPLQRMHITSCELISSQIQLKWVHAQHHGIV